MPAQTEDTPRPQRMTLSRMLERLTDRGRGDRSSVSIARHVNGATSFDVKVATGDEGEILTPEQAEAKARAIFESLAKSYPVADDADDADVTITRNAKGDVQLSVGVKTTPGELSRTGKVVERAWKAFDNLASRYPFPTR